jgi:hypothetical protein
VRWVVLASGQSLTKEQVDLCLKAREADQIKGIVAVSNVGLDLCPQADVLVSHDTRWWTEHPEALKFPGRRFCRSKIRGADVFRPSISGCNSGLMAMEVAFHVYKASEIIILGFDMHGTHYFGVHRNGLKNTNVHGFRRHLAQFNSWKGCPVINCTVGSSLKKFPFLSLEEVLQSGNGI